MTRSNLPPKEDKKKKGLLGKRPRKEEYKTEEQKKNEKSASEAKEGTEMFTRRLQKSKVKELSVKLNTAFETGSETWKIKQELDRTKKAVFTDERRIEQRKAGYERAKTNAKSTILSEFM